MLDTTTYLPQLKIFEGVSSWMYVDTTGNVTVGVGNLLANATAAQLLAFVLRSNPDAGPATADDIQQDFDNVRQQTPGRLVSFYEQFTRLNLPDSVIDSLLNSRVVEFTTGIRAVFPDYDSYPAEACAAIFDMAFNLGLGELTSGFPHFCRAVKTRDWATAASQCKRNGIGDSRNNWTEAQLQAAAKANQTASSPLGERHSASAG
jgi:GH24 family phage-related lysozyme (muramidase)